MNTKRKPDWIRVHLPKTSVYAQTNKLVHQKKLFTVCEEAACPNQGECFDCGTATFLIMGDTCTRNCKFCNVHHGKPNQLDTNEPADLANTIAAMQLKYVVLTSVDRDDLDDGGAQHFVDCMHAIRQKNPFIKIEILTPDFQRCMEKALDVLSLEPPDVFNHNIETAPRLFQSICPGCDYDQSLTLLRIYKERFPTILTKSGMMLGLGETDDEIVQVMEDLYQNKVNMLTLGQYLQPSIKNIPVDRYVHPDDFEKFKKIAETIGFKYVASGPFVRSSYHADRQCDCGEL